jgi:curved DNA-binding protein CbpA
VSESQQPNHYEVLGVRVEANTEVVRKAWLLAAWDHHPDRHDESERDAHTELMRAVNSAYQTLSDPARRRRYDLEHGLIPAACGICGGPGSLRLDDRGQAVPVCSVCFQPRTRIIAL